MRTPARLISRILVAATAALVAANLGATTAAADDRQQVSVDVRVGHALTQAGVDPIWTTAPAASVESAAEVTVSPDTPAARITAEDGGAGIQLLDSQAVKSEATTLGQLFGDVARDTDAAVQATEGGVRVLSIMHTPAAPTTQRYRLDLPAGTALNAIGGGYLLKSADGKVVGAIEAPWAKDASGRSLPTRYDLEGAVLVQRTDTTAATFPVVADPKITVGASGVYLNLWGTEAKLYATAIVAVIGGGIAIACTLVGNIPNPVLKSLAILICGSAAVSLRSVFDAIVRAWRSGVRGDWCYQWRIFPSVTSAKHVSASNCR